MASEVRCGGDDQGKPTTSSCAQPQVLFKRSRRGTQCWPTDLQTPSLAQPHYHTVGHRLHFTNEEQVAQGSRLRGGGGRLGPRLLLTRCGLMPLITLPLQTCEGAAHGAGMRSCQGHKRQIQEAPAPRSWLQDGGTRQRDLWKATELISSKARKRTLDS